MDEKILNEAVENISLIRGVIDRTRKSFAAFSRIFIYWGLLFILNSMLQEIMLANKEQVSSILTKFPFVNYVFPVGIIALFAFLIYRSISKKIPLVGLEKHLMKIWMLILLLNVIPHRISIATTAGVDLGLVTVETDNLGVMLFSLAIALIITSMFTEYKQPMYVGLVYIFISVLHSCFAPIIIIPQPLVQIICFVSLPFTFLYTGFFFKSRQAGRE